MYCRHFARKLTASAAVAAASFFCSFASPTPAAADARGIIRPVEGTSGEDLVSFLQGLGGEVLAAVSSQTGAWVVAHLDEPHVGALRRSPIVDPYFRIDASCEGWGPPCTTAPVAVTILVDASGLPAVEAILEGLGGTISESYPPEFQALVPVGSLLDLEQELATVAGATLAGLYEIVDSGCGECGRGLDPIAVGEGRRFSVQAWTVPIRAHSNGWELGTDSATFYFFDPGNAEVLVKVLKGCELNGHWWVFAAGLTDRFVHVRVATWRQGSELVRTYESAAGTPFAPILDFEAFPCES